MHQPDSDSKLSQDEQDRLAKHAAEIDFATFVESLAQEALVHLGVLPHPETAQSERNFPLARQSIDILEMLQKKTRGNLNEHEEKLMSAVLHDLRLLYVQHSKEQ